MNYWLQRYDRRNWITDLPDGYGLSYCIYENLNCMVLMVYTKQRTIKTNISIESLRKYGVNEVLRPEIGRMVRELNKGANGKD